MFKKRLLWIPFLATVIIYAVGLFWSVQAYEEWKKAELESYPPVVRPYVDFDPYPSSKHGGDMILLGAIIGLAWVMIFSIVKRADRKTMDRFNGSF